jgi:hypothetical protein
MAAKDDFDLFSSIVEMLGLEPEEAESFLTSAMRRRGHKPTIKWDDSDEGGGEGGGDFFSSKRREKRQVGGGQRQGKKAAGGGWQYGE